MPSSAQSPLHALHLALGAKMVPFAGHDMPLHYPSGILAEHLHTRAQAGLFDVSHMGQIRLSRVRGREDDLDRMLERLVPGDIAGLGPGRQRYTQFTNDACGILDDLMVTRWGEDLFLVVNAACKTEDIAHLERGLDGAARVEPLADRALLAVQGPAAADVLGRLAPACRVQKFMSMAVCEIAGVSCLVTRSGYTGEDGFEISAPGDAAEKVARRLLQETELRPAGLGARDSLRLEAGLCLYGHDIDPTTTPVEADLTWSVGKRRRSAGGFPGADIFRAQLETGPRRKRVGLRPAGRVIAREGTGITDATGRPVGRVTSGGFGPSVDGPIAMGYVETTCAAPDTPLRLVVRGTAHEARVVPMPFVPHRYHHG